MGCIHSRPMPRQTSSDRTRNVSISVSQHQYRKRSTTSHLENQNSGRAHTNDSKPSTPNTPNTPNSPNGHQVHHSTATFHRWSMHSNQSSQSLGIPRKPSGGTPRHSLAGSSPPTVESFLAKRNNKRRKLPSLPKFGAPLSQQTLRKLNEETDYKVDSIVIKKDYELVPSILILLKKYLLRFSGYQYIGIFANGSIQNIEKYHVESSEEIPFVTGYVSKVDVYGIKSLIESNKIANYDFSDTQETHYAMVFAELIKLWLQYLSIGLMNCMQSSFFAGITSTGLLQLEMSQIPEPHLSTFLFILDICVEVTNNCTVNQMTEKRMATIMGPYLVKEKDYQKFEQIKPALINFFEIAIRWRKGSAVN